MSVTARGVKNAFRNTIRSISMTAILALTIALALVMLLLDLGDLGHGQRLADALEAGRARRRHRDAYEMEEGKLVPGPGVADVAGAVTS